MASATSLREIRSSLGLTQEDVVRRTKDVKLRTYVRAEGGERVRYSTASEILNVVNELLVEAGRPTVTLDDLGLALF